ncbi:hypothetical protein Bca52824_060101 [Brassica carinata]|uniref:Pentatricopeptide repeat-containing protein n=1 Tax=Brassica carinata TaxID=52824 RepID=A0A8X7UHA6_BRACI|nr:hypothetical protein Bca52824_060101 [Brassica carinata]
MSSHSQLRLIINEFSSKFQTKLNTRNCTASSPNPTSRVIPISPRSSSDTIPQTMTSSPHANCSTYFPREATWLLRSFDTEGLRCIHGNAVVSGLGFDRVCGSTLVKAYSKAGFTFEASKLFFSIPEPDVPLWNAMISGYGSCEEGIDMFNLMLRHGNRPDCYTMVALMTGVVDPGSTLVARSVHGFCLKVGLDSHSYVGSALVSMYSRCKCIASACGVFSSISEPTDLVACSSLVTCYSRCGYHKEALCLFNELRMSGKKPDSVLVAIVLGSCAELSDSLYGKEVHSYVIRQGMELDIKVSSALIDMYSKCGILDSAMTLFAEVAEKALFLSTLSLSLLFFVHVAILVFYEAQEIFMRMKSDFGVEPRTEHHIYIVKLMGMVGKLEEAFEFVMSLRKPIDSGIWGALLSCCEVHEDAHLAGVRRRSVYNVMLSNVYARYGKWDEAEMLRDGISESFGGKLPGISWF